MEQDYTDLEAELAKIQSSERDAKASTQYAEAKISTLQRELADGATKVSPPPPPHCATSQAFPTPSYCRSCS